MLRDSRDRLNQRIDHSSNVHCTIDIDLHPYLEGAELEEKPIARLYIC